MSEMRLRRHLPLHDQTLTSRFLEPGRALRPEDQFMVHRIDHPQRRWEGQVLDERIRDAVEPPDGVEQIRYEIKRRVPDPFR